MAIDGVSERTWRERWFMACPEATAEDYGRVVASGRVMAEMLDEVHLMLRLLHERLDRLEALTWSIASPLQRAEAERLVGAGDEPPSGGL